MRQQNFVNDVIGSAKCLPVVDGEGNAFAPSNIALCKYWGKRDSELNLPLTSSLSVSLGDLGTKTKIRLVDGSTDQIFLNGTAVSEDKPFAKRMSAFLNLFRPNGFSFVIETVNNIPTAAGLASSASGFAALVMALDDLFGWNLPRKNLSMLARLGSGSASRSVYNGFAIWHGGFNDDGLDSFAEKLPFEWPDFRIGILELCSGEKPVGSRDGMNRTVATSKLFEKWPEKVAEDLNSIKSAIESQDFSLLGKSAESNALAMHATMMDAWPPLMYFQPESVAMMHKIWSLRNDGLELYFTMDAGPNLKLLFTSENQQVVESHFAGLQTISPFA